MEQVVIGTLVLCGVLVGVIVTAMVMKKKQDRATQEGHLEVEAQATAMIEEAKAYRRKEEMAIQARLKETKEASYALKKEQKRLDNEAKKLQERATLLEQKRERLAQLEREKERAIDEVLEKMESLFSLSQQEAKAYFLEQVEQKSRLEVATIVRKYEQQAKEEGKKRAFDILAQATTRYAGEFAGERLMNLVTLPSEEHKGRIIGKEGRNIKSLEMLLGVDIVVDETPNVILVSSFNLYRRAIATEVLEILIEDGRIHPGRIEEVHQRVVAEFEQKTYEEGENILIDLGLYPMAEELVRLLGRLKYRASYGQNALAHTLEVAKLAQVMAGEMGGDEKLALRAGLLHDIGKALTQEEGGSHVELGAKLCQKHHEHPTVINAIYAHHGYEEPDSVESAAVCAADTLSAARPGARREVLEQFTKRVSEIEAIAKEDERVIDAYAIHAGREVRVFVNAQKITDAEAVLLSKEIAKKIETSVQYPGEIKVNLIREMRTTSTAR